jgi:hypothetical protein
VPRSARWGGYLATAVGVLVVLVVAGAFLLVRSGRGGTNVSPAVAADARVVLSAPPGTPAPAVGRAADIVRRRLQAAVPGARVSVVEGGIVVSAPPAARGEILALAAPGVLAFYDWEGQVLAPNGKTLASQLPSPNPMVLAISQGYGSSAPGQLGAGCVPLGQALALAAKAGAGRPHRIEYLGSLRLRVPVGYTVLQAAGPSPGRASDGYFVIREHPALAGGELVDPRASTDPNIRVPDVEFGFTAAGKRDFHAVTRAIARRGEQVSSPGQTLNQHFALALDNRLLSVPFIDFKQYPNGITGDNGADVIAGPTSQSARNLAVVLRYGPLPVNLTAAG